MRRTLAISLTLALALCTPASAEFYTQEDMDRFVRSNPHPLHGTVTQHFSQLHKLTAWWIPVPRTEDVVGGALATIGDILFVVQPRGALEWMEIKRGHGPYSTGTVAPMNFEALQSSPRLVEMGEFVKYFRSAGAYVEDRPEGPRLYVSHHVFDNECIYFQVSRIDLAFNATDGIKAESDWQRVFRSEPCIEPLDDFSGHISGGRIAELDGDHLLVTYGDHDLVGTETAAVAAAQDPAWTYGKFWKVAKDGSTASIYGRGTRNPQGLVIDDEGRIWSTEHGQQGGDELNLIVEGANYGWPLRSYGVDYGDHAWLYSPRQGDHTTAPEFRKPVLAWVPSIAPTNLVQVDGPGFSLWTGDLLVATLRDQSVRRLRLDGGRVVYDERIAMGERLRDIVRLADGRFAVMADREVVGILDDAGPKLNPPKGTGSALAAAFDDPDEARGAMVFENVCLECHSLTDIDRQAAPLMGIGGRRIGKMTGFQFSERLATSNGQWDLASFVSFVVDPAVEFAGSSMPAMPITPLGAEQIYQFLNSSTTRQIANSAAGAGPEAEFARLARESVEAPFEIPFAADEPWRAEPFIQVIPDFWVGFSPRSAAVVEVAQRPSTEAELGATGHQYVLDVDVRALDTSTFVSIENLIDSLPAEPLVVDVSLTGRSEPGGWFNLELSIPTLDGDDQRFPVGAFLLAPETSSIATRTILDLSTVAEVDPSRRSRLILLLPKVEPARLLLEDYRISFTRMDDFGRQRVHSGVICTGRCPDQ